MKIINWNTKIHNLVLKSMAKRKKQDEDSDEDFDPSSVEMTVELSSLDNQVDLLPVRKSYTDEFFLSGSNL